MRTSRKTDLRQNKDFRSSKNNFRGHDISQGLDREPLSLSPHFLLTLVIASVCNQSHGFEGNKGLISRVSSTFSQRQGQFGKL